MRLLEVSIQNFKSLKSVTLKPGPLSVFIGPNGAGKSNLCEALAFTNDMYRWGLEHAVARYGGYENICFRHTRRSTAPIAFSLAINSSGERFWPAYRRDGHTRRLDSLVTERRIAFRAASQNVRAPFSITEESLSHIAHFSSSPETEVIFSALRRGEKIARLHVSRQFEDVDGQNVNPNDDEFRKMLSERLNPTESFEGSFPFSILDRPWRGAGRPTLGLYQVQPLSGRLPGVPIPNPELDRDGSNLPGVIDMIKSREPQAFQAVLGTLRIIMPTLRDIDVVSTPQRTLGLVFHEEGFRQPWPVEHISDGTLRALGLLTALFSSHADMVIIEEPENSLHPWAIGQFIDACREASKSKQIMLTTHSPVVVDQLKPDEIWVVSKPGAETKVERLIDLDSVAQTGWEDGHFTLSEFLDSGIVPGTVPAL
jgi:predicted ATPase